MSDTAELTRPARIADKARIFAFSGAVTLENVEDVAEQIRKRHLPPGEVLVLDVLQMEIAHSGSELLRALAHMFTNTGGALVIIKPKAGFADQEYLLPQLTLWEESRWLKKC